MYFGMMMNLGLNFILVVVGMRMKIPIEFLGVMGMLIVGFMMCLLAYQYIPLLWWAAGISIGGSTRGRNRRR